MSNSNTDGTVKSGSIHKAKKKFFQVVSVVATLTTGGFTLVSTPALARPYDEPVSPNPAKLVDQLMSYSLKDFMRVREARASLPNLVWTTDLCSSPARGTGVSFDFTNACIRHDFGYRNYKKLGLFTENKRGTVDGIFLKDMKEHCSTRSVLLKPGCYAAAGRYYTAVRNFGN